MNKICTFFLLFLFSAVAAQQATKSPFTDWITVYEEVSDQNSKKVEIAYSLSKCDDQGFLIGYSYFKIRNGFNREKATLTFKIDYIRCDQTTDTESIVVNLAQTGEQKTPEMWFMGKTVAGRPYDVKLLDYNKARAEVVTTTKTSEPIAEQPIEKEIPKQILSENSVAENDLTALIKKGDIAFEQNKLIDAMRWYNEARERGAGEEIAQKIRMVDQKLDGKFQSTAVNPEKPKTEKPVEPQQVVRLVDNVVIVERPITGKPTEPQQTQQVQEVVTTQEAKSPEAVKVSEKELVRNPEISKKTYDFDDTLTNYLNAKKDRFTEETVEGENTKAIYYLNCQLDFILKENFSKRNPKGIVRCDYDNGSSRFQTISLASAPKIDSINYYYNTQNLKKGLAVIRGDRNRDLFFAGEVVSRLSYLYDLSLYTTRREAFGPKEQENFKKQVSQKKLVSHEILKASVTNFFKDKNCEFAKFGLQHLIANETDAYFKKISYLFLAVINNYEEKTSGRHNPETPELLKRAMAINKSDFLKIGNSYYDNATFGLYIYPEYYDLIQMAIIEETAEYYYNQQDTNLDYALPYQSFFNYFNSIKG